MSSGRHRRHRPRRCWCGELVSGQGTRYCGDDHRRIAHRVRRADRNDRGGASFGWAVCAYAECPRAGKPFIRTRYNSLYDSEQCRALQFAKVRAAAAARSEPPPLALEDPVAYADALEAR